LQVMSGPRVGTVEVTADGEGLVSHAGAVLLVELADRVGLTAHDPGRVLVDLAVMLADGGDSITDMDAYRARSGCSACGRPRRPRIGELKSIDEALLGRALSANLR